MIKKQNFGQRLNNEFFFITIDAHLGSKTTTEIKIKIRKTVINVYF
jgi:hypothetical protein